MTTTVQQASWEDPEPEEGGRYTGILIAVGLFVLACVVACIVGVALDGTQTDQDKRYAISACQNAVKDLLKAPTTATFENGTNEKSVGTWDVAGRVTAQNSYGAALTEPFICLATNVNGEWSGKVNLLGDHDLGLSE
jgi:hypothetical protein